MTVAELMALTDQDFDQIVMAIDGTIMFGIPIPGHPELECEIGQDGHISRMTHAEENLDAWEEAWEEYISKLLAAPPEKRHNRTRRQAEAAGIIVSVPDKLAIISRAPYQDAISTRENPVAHLQPITKELANQLRFDNGKLYFGGGDALTIDLVEYYDKTPRAVSNLDIPTLQVLYSVILQDLASMLKDPDTLAAMAKDPQYLSHSVRIYLPDFMRKAGYSANSSNDMQNILVDKIMGYQSILGIMEDRSSGRVYQSKYPVMLFIGYDAIDNTLSFASPYFNKLVMEITKASILRNKNGKPKLSNTGEVFTQPTHSYLIKSSIANERNKRAVQIVEIVVLVIEQAGNNTPHIKAQTIVDRCPDLKNALDAASTADKNRILKRAFSKAWELLRTQTTLRENYKNIRFPDKVPTSSILDMTFEFPHDGKIKKSKKSR